ncbi:hypothetical protein LTR53_010287, partial [Teratosphaeriaceae sp. CCFEE 6253]
PLHTPALLDDEKGMLRNVLSKEDLQGLLDKARSTHQPVEVPGGLFPPRGDRQRRSPSPLHADHRAESPSLGRRLSGWLGGLQSRPPSGAPSPTRTSTDPVRSSRPELRQTYFGSARPQRRESVIDELRRQAGVLWDDTEADGETASETEGDDGVTSEDEHAQDSDVVASEPEGDAYSTGTVRRRPRTASPGSISGSEERGGNEAMPTMLQVLRGGGGR